MSDLLWNEYQLIYQTYEAYNGQFLSLKGWSATVGIAALIAAYTHPTPGSGRLGVLVAACSAVPFWLTETFWKLFQKSYEPRIAKLEECAREPLLDCPPMQIYTAWDATFSASSFRLWTEGAFDWHVLLPHAALFFGGIALAILSPPSQG